MFAKSLHIENLINVAKPALGWISNDTLALHTAASLLMALACFALPLAIYYFLKKRQDLKQTSLILYPLLILLALNGVVYLAEVVTSWEPALWLWSGLLKLASAVLAVGTMALILIQIPKLLRALSPRALQDINLKLQKEIAERAQIEEELQVHKNNLEQLVQKRTEDLEYAAVKLKEEINERQVAQGQVAFQASLLDQLEGAIIAVNREREIVYCNYYAEKLLGRTEGEILGKHKREVFLDKSDRKTLDMRLEKLERQKRWEGDTTVVHKNGQTIPVHMNATVLRDHDQQEIGYAFVCFDIRGHINQEKRLRKAKERAEKATLAKQDFLSTMSHEIRTPLNVVIGMARLLMDEDPKPEQVDYLKSLQFSANNLLVIINDILDFSKIEAGKVKLEKISFSVREVVEGVAKAFSFQAEEKNVNLKVSLSEALPEQVLGDQTRLTQILNNLVSNALKFTERGFVSIHAYSIQTKEQELEIGFEVKDTGIGISANKMDSIFSSYTQAQADTNRKFGGTGLGLTICKKLVELQKGKIQVKSKEGIGSTFSFTVVYEKSSASAPVAYEESELPSLEGIRLLLVDDNPSNRMVARSFLEKMKVQVDHAEDGRAAFEAVKTYAYDIVLMDLQMPQMNGYEATQAIRKLGGQYEKLPIIALSADVMGAKDRVLEAGMNDYMAKPFSPETLYRKISQNIGLIAREAAPVEEETLTLRDIAEQYGNDYAFITHLLGTMRNSFEKFPQEIETAVKEQNLHDLRRLIHKMLPSIKMTENQDLQYQLTQLKQAMSREETNKRHIQQLLATIKKLATTSIALINEIAQEVEEQHQPMQQA